MDDYAGERINEHKYRSRMPYEKRDPRFKKEEINSEVFRSFSVAGTSIFRKRKRNHVKYL